MVDILFDSENPRPRGYYFTKSTTCIPGTGVSQPQVNRGADCSARRAYSRRVGFPAFKAPEVRSDIRLRVRELERKVTLQIRLLDDKLIGHSGGHFELAGLDDELVEAVFEQEDRHVGRPGDPHLVIVLPTAATKTGTHRSLCVAHQPRLRTNLLGDSRASYFTVFLVRTNAFGSSPMSTRSSLSVSWLILMYGSPVTLADTTFDNV